MKYTIALLVVAAVLHVALASCGYEVNVVSSRFSRVTDIAAVHKPDLTGDDIAAFADIKNDIFSLIDRGLLEATQQTVPWYAGMHLEFYKCKSGLDKTFISLPATSKIHARELSGAPPNWAYDEQGRKYYDLRDGDKPVAMIYYPPGQ